MIEGMLPMLQTHYLSDRSLFVDLLALSWSASYVQGYIEYPQVMKGLLGVLGEEKVQAEVYEQLLEMLRVVIQKAKVQDDEEDGDAIIE
jgi:hypothetical protein